MSVSVADCREHPLHGRNTYVRNRATEVISLVHVDCQLAEIRPRRKTLLERLTPLIRKLQFPL